MGEIGLAGELRRVRGLDERLSEAARLGFAVAVVPLAERGEHGAYARPKERTVDGMKVYEVHDLATAISLLRLTGSSTDR